MTWSTLLFGCRDVFFSLPRLVLGAVYSGRVTIDITSVSLPSIGHPYGAPSTRIPGRARGRGELHAGGGAALDRPAVAQPADPEAGEGDRPAALRPAAARRHADRGGALAPGPRPPHPRGDRGRQAAG